MSVMWMSPQAKYTVHPDDIIVKFTAPADQIIYSGKRVTEKESEVLKRNFMLADMIILTYTDDVRRKWIFTEIEENCFHWQNVTVKNNGEWHINAEMYAERI